MANLLGKIFSGGDEDEYFEDEQMNQQPAQQVNYQQPQPQQPVQQRGSMFSLGGNRNNDNNTQQFAGNMQNGQPNPSSQSPIGVIRPKVFSDAKQIASNLLMDTPVIIDFAEIDGTQMNRAIDFISGAVYMIKGNLSKVRDGVFIVTPQNYLVEGDIVNSSSNGANNMYSNFN